MAELRIGQQADFDAFYSLLEESFPTDEFRPCQAQRELLSNEAYTLFLVCEQGVLQAAAAVWRFSDFAFLEHLAVRTELRSQGIGAKLLRELQVRLRVPICLEVELPETELASRRIGFYERCGFIYNDFDYIQPAFSPQQNPVPLRIMSSGAALSEKAFLAVKDTLYRDVYKVNV